MKTKMKWKSMAKVFTFLVMMTLVFTTISCRKNESDPAPGPVPPAGNTGITDPFSHGDYKFMTDYEIAHNKKFGGSLLYNVGTGVSNAIGENVIPNIPYSDAMKLIWNVYKYKTKVTPFDSTDYELGQLSNQISELQNDIMQIVGDLEMTQTEILNAIDALETNDEISYSENAYDSATNTGLMYYSYNARLIQQGHGIMPIDTLQTNARKFFVERYHSATSAETDMIGNIGNINTSIMGGTNVYNFNSSVLKRYADGVILNSSGNAMTKQDTNAMNSYKLLENYFLMLLNSQYKALLVYGNAEIAYDTLYGPGIIQQYHENYFEKYIIQELKMFLNVVDYLSVNLVDYRTLGRFAADMDYLSFGIKYDAACSPFLQRANLLNSMILRAVGAPTKDFYITLALPQKYCSSTALSWSFDMDSYPFVLDNNGNLESQYPHTYWNGSTCSADNIISFYRGNGGNFSTAFTQKFADIGISNSPWFKKAGVSMFANVPICWVNPNDPTKTSSTYSATYCLAYGSASLYWPWGYMFVNDQKNLQSAQKFPGSVFGSAFTGEQLDLPSIVGNNGGNLPAAFTYDDCNLGFTGLQYSGNNGGTWFINYRSANINVSPNPNSGNNISVFSSWAATPPPNETGAEIWMSGATYIPDNKVNVPLNADLFLIHTSSPFSKAIGLSWVNISSGPKCMNYGFAYDIYKPTSKTLQFGINYFNQTIYWGTYNIWN